MAALEEEPSTATKNTESASTNDLDPWAYNATSRPADIPIELLTAGRSTSPTSQSPSSPSFSAISHLIHSDKYNDQLQGTMLLRKLVSTDTNPHIKETIDSGLGPKVVEFLDRSDQPQLQFEAAWLLTNVLSDDNLATQYVINIGAIPKLRDLLSSNCDDCREQAIWAIGNLAGTGIEERDLALGLGCVQPLVDTLAKPVTSPTVSRVAVWALGNLCRLHPAPDPEKVLFAIDCFIDLIKRSDDAEVVMDATWGLSYLVSNPSRPQKDASAVTVGHNWEGEGKHNEYLQRIAALSSSKWIAPLLQSQDVHTVNPALRILMALLTSGIGGILDKTIFDAQLPLLSIVSNLLVHNDEKIRLGASQAFKVLFCSAELINRVLEAHPTTINFLTKRVRDDISGGNGSQLSLQGVMDTVACYTINANSEQILHLVDVCGLIENGLAQVLTSLTAAPCTDPMILLPYAFVIENLLSKYPGGSTGVCDDDEGRMIKGNAKQKESNTAANPVLVDRLESNLIIKSLYLSQQGLVEKGQEDTEVHSRLSTLLGKYFENEYGDDGYDL